VKKGKCKSTYLEGYRRQGPEELVEGSPILGSPERTRNLGEWGHRKVIRRFVEADLNQKGGLKKGGGTLGGQKKSKFRQTETKIKCIYRKIRYLRP